MIRDEHMMIDSENMTFGMAFTSVCRFMCVNIDEYSKYYKFTTESEVHSRVREQHASLAVAFTC
jgi:hypothetical protein